MSIRGFGPVGGHGRCAGRVVLTSGEEGDSAPVQANSSGSVLYTQLPDDCRDNRGNESDQEQLSSGPNALKT